jgi:hypothetical protein
MFRYSLAVITVVTLAACSTAAPPRTLPASVDPTSLPEAARAALDAKWPKSWSVAPLAPQLTSCLSGKSVSPVVVADFDSDNASDLAAAITTPQGVRLVVLLQRDDHYAVFNVDAIDPASPVAVGLEKRGAPYTKADTLFRDFYSADTVTAYTCNGATTSYFWGGLDFYKVALAPSPR